ncbi:retrovirus-related pol polyprotein from transposon TNT 1-94 [Tanacetum coccineum]
MMDSGASHHLTSCPSTLSFVSEYGDPDKIVLGDGTNLSISHSGSTHIYTSSKSLDLLDILCVPKLRKNLISVAHKTGKLNVKYYNPHFVNNTTLHPVLPPLEPHTYLQASKDPLWRQAMDNEYNVLPRNHTWELVPPTSRHPIGFKWVFRIKRHPDGTINKYKERLVAKGFLQEYVCTKLASRFSIKDLGYPSHVLGVELIPIAHGLFLLQHRHILDILTMHHMDGAKPVLTQLCSSETLKLDDGTPRVDPSPYRKLVGSLQYLAFTKMNISFAINKLSQFMHDQSQTHWQVLKHLLRCLKRTLYYGLFLTRKSPMELTAFSDLDWGGVSTTGRSTTAYILYLGLKIISWKSAKHKSVSCSSTEAEYKALANAAAGLAWVENLLTELGLTLQPPPLLYYDNIGATYLCANPVYHSCMKHFALDYRFVREKVPVGSLRVHHINSTDQLADALTKPLSRAPFLSLRSKIGVSDGSSILWGRITTNNMH